MYDSGLLSRLLCSRVSESLSDDFCRGSPRQKFIGDTPTVPSSKILSTEGRGVVNDTFTCTES